VSLTFDWLPSAWFGCVTWTCSRCRTASGSIDRSGSCPQGVAHMRQRKEGGRTGAHGGHSRGPKCPARDWGRIGPHPGERDSRAVPGVRARHKGANRERSRMLRWGRWEKEGRKTRRASPGDDRGDEVGGNLDWTIVSRFAPMVRAPSLSAARGCFREGGSAWLDQNLLSCMRPSHRVGYSPA
jgi:hypothetical protein